MDFFGETTARTLRREGLRADLLIGNNVLAHVPNLNDFVKGLKIVLAEQGIITMEFPHLMRLCADCQIDTIYHEHFSYFSLIAVEKIFAAHGLTLFDVEDCRRTEDRYASLRSTGRGDASQSRSVSKSFGSER